MNMGPLEIKEKTRAIVCFGPATDMTGNRPGEYLQVVIDPNMVSPGGEFIRFDQFVQGGELHGWQRVAAMTVCEVLGPEGPYERGLPAGYEAVEGASVTMRAVT